jgi:hypothetical protein
MKASNFFIACAGCLCAALIVLSPARLNAQGIMIELNNVYSGVATPPAGPGPWVDVTIMDVSPGTVTLTVANVGLAGTEFVDGGGGLYLNLDPTMNPNGLVFAYNSSIGSFTIPTQGAGTIETGANNFKADGDGKYDIKITFDPSDGAATRFGGGDSVTYTITGIAGLVSTDFAFQSTSEGGYGPYYAAAHIQDTPGGSCWIDGFPYELIPEPSSVTLFALALGIWGALRRAKG